MRSKVLSAIGLIFQIYKLVQLKRTINYYQKLINQIISLDVLSIKQLKTKIAQGLYKIGDTILCHGNIKPSEPIRSLLDPSRSIAYSQIVMEKIFEIGDSRNTVTKPIRKLVSGYLKLFQREEHVKVFETINADVICSRVFKKRVSFREKIFNFGWLMSVLFRSPTRVVSNVYYQSYIPENSETTVFGKISRSKSGQLQIVRPMAIAQNKTRILKAYQTYKQNNKYFSYLLYLTILITCFLIWKQIIQPYLANRNSQSSRRRKQMQKLQRIQVKDYNCSICHNVLSNIINKPCGHLVVCSECKKEGDCLECNRRPREVVMVYPC